MNWYKIAQYSSLMYHGTKEAHGVLSKKEFPGVFLNPDPMIAKKEGVNVYVYQIKEGRFFSPDILAPSDVECLMVTKFIRSQNITSNAPCKKLLSSLLQAPTKNWVDYLSKFGYSGYVILDRLFLFNPLNARYIGRYNFENGVVE